MSDINDWLSKGNKITKLKSEWARGAWRSKPKIHTSSMPSLIDLASSSAVIISNAQKDTYNNTNLFLAQLRILELAAQRAKKEKK